VATVGNLNIVDIIPNIASAESEQNSEPSLAVDPLDPRQMIAGSFGSGTPFFKSVNVPLQIVTIRGGGGESLAIIVLLSQASRALPPQLAADRRWSKSRMDAIGPKAERRSCHRQYPIPRGR
jgi:hypothetical protein